MWDTTKYGRNALLSTGPINTTRTPIQNNSSLSPPYSTDLSLSQCLLTARATSLLRMSWRSGRQAKRPTLQLYAETALVAIISTATSPIATVIIAYKNHANKQRVRYRLQPKFGRTRSCCLRVSSFCLARSVVSVLRGRCRLAAGTSNVRQSSGSFLTACNELSFRCCSVDTSSTNLQTLLQDKLCPTIFGVFGKAFNEASLRHCGIDTFVNESGSSFAQRKRFNERTWKQHSVKGVPLLRRMNVPLLKSTRVYTNQMPSQSVVQQGLRNRNDCSLSFSGIRSRADGDAACVSSHCVSGIRITWEILFSSLAVIL